MPGRAAQSPDRDDSSQFSISECRMVVDHGKALPAQATSIDPPIAEAEVRAPGLVSIANYVLDIEPAQASLSRPIYRVLGPDESLDHVALIVRGDGAPNKTWVCHLCPEIASSPPATPPH